MLAHVGVHLVETHDGGDLANRVEDVADAARGAAYVVEVLAVSPRPIKPHLVQAGAAAKDQLLPEQGMVGDLNDQPLENEILLDLFKCRPRGMLLPVGNVCLGDHNSCSISVLTTTCQRGSRQPLPRPDDRCR